MDYCTLWLEGWWSHCCAAHDSDYASQIGQLVADERLASCVASALPAFAADNTLLVAGFSVVSSAVAGLMFMGVRVFGRRFYRRAKEQ